jgi:hypothetical protein
MRAPGSGAEGIVRLLQRIRVSIVSARFQTLSARAIRAGMPQMQFGPA